MNDNAIELLGKADSLLDKVEVSGVNAYLLVDARKILKKAFDVLKSEKEGTDG